MGGLFLIGFAIAVYLLNQQPGTHIGLRGLPWLNVPITFSVLGILHLVARFYIRRYYRLRRDRMSDEDL